jgi:cysteine desulfuration protein SufE
LQKPRTPRIVRLLFVMSESNIGNITLERVREVFEFFEDWEEKYKYLMDLGKKLPPLPDEDKVEENRVRGCQSTVWLTFEPGEAPGSINFKADSDAFIVKGLIALLLLLYSGKSAEEICSFDPQPLFQELGLDQHLSPTRKNGLNSMIERIRSIGKSASAA